MKLVSYRFVSAAFLFVTTLSTSAQERKPHFRSTFVVATESTIDTVSAVDIDATASNYDAALKAAQTARTNLQQMATEEGEQDVVSSVDDLYFAISACHIQAVDNADTTACKAQVSRARNRAMTTLGKHKENGAWVDGAPA